MDSYLGFKAHYSIRCDACCKHADKNGACPTGVHMREYLIKQGIQSAVIIISSCKYCETIENDINMQKVRDKRNNT